MKRRKSIIHDKKDGTCFLCMMLYNDDGKKITEEHHVFFGNGLRNLSEYYGLKVQLCIPHHRGSSEGVHFNIQNSRMVQAYAQRVFENKFPEKNFRKIFGRNYIMDEETEETKPDPVAGFRTIPDGLEGIDW